MLFLFFLFLITPERSYGDMLSLEVGAGFHYSNDSEALFLRYQRDAAPWFGLTEYFEFSLGGWNGPTGTEAIGISRGAAWFWNEKHYLAGSAGIGYIAEETENLGTHGQLLFRVAFGRRGETYDLSLGWVHYSNGKYFFGWDGPNNGENFFTFQVGRVF